MVAWELAKSDEPIAPPTREIIERDRRRQLETIQALRRELADRLAVAR